MQVVIDGDLSKELRLGFLGFRYFMLPTAAIQLREWNVSLSDLFGLCFC